MELRERLNQEGNFSSCEEKAEKWVMFVDSCQNRRPQNLTFRNISSYMVYYPFLPGGPGRK